MVLSPIFPSFRFSPLSAVIHPFPSHLHATTFWLLNIQMLNISFEKLGLNLRAHVFITTG